MATLGVAEVELRARVTQFQRDMEGAARTFNDAASSMQRAGRTLTRTITLPLAALGGASAKAAADFEVNMSRIEGLVGVNRDTLKEWEQDVQSLAVEYGSSASKAADALFFITSAGLRGSTAMEVLEASLKASASGLGEVNTIADLATSAVNAYGAETLSAANATDVLTNAVREGKLPPEELAGAIGQVLPVASNMGVRFDEVGAAMAAMSRTGTNASMAAVQLRQIMVSLLKPSVEAQDALASMGTSASELRQQIRDEGLLAVLQTLAVEFERNEDASSQVFGNIRALSGVLDLMGSSADATVAIFDSLADSSGVLDEAFAAQQTTTLEFKRAWAGVQDLLLEIGNHLLPSVSSGLRDLQDALAGASEWVRELDKGTARILVSFGVIASILGPALISLGLLARVLGAASAGIATLTGVIAPIVSGITGWVAAMGGLALSVRSAADAVALFTSGIGRPLLTALTAVTRLNPIIAGITTVVLGGIAVWSRWGEEISETVVAVVRVLKQRLVPAVEDLQELGRQIADWGRVIRDRFLAPLWDLIEQAATILVDRLGAIVSGAAGMLEKALRIINPAAARGIDDLRNFVDDVQKELIRMRGGVEVDAEAAGAALIHFQEVIREFSQEDLEATATGLGIGLIRAQEELVRLEEAQSEAMSGTQADVERATEAVTRQQQAVNTLRANYLAVAEAVRESVQAQEDVAEPGGGGDQVQTLADQVDLARERVDVLEAALGLGIDEHEVLVETLETMMLINKELDDGVDSLERRVILTDEERRLREAILTAMPDPSESGLVGAEGVRDLRGPSIDHDAIIQSTRQTAQVMQNLGRHTAQSTADSFEGSWQSAISIVGSSLGGLASQAANVITAFMSGGPSAGLPALAGAVIGIVGGQSEAERKFEEAARTWEQNLNDFANMFADESRWQQMSDQLRDGAVEMLEQAVQSLGDESSFFKHFNDQIMEMINQVADTQGIEAAIDAAVELAAASGASTEELEQLAEALRANVERIRELRQEAIEDERASLRMIELRAQGLDDEAAALQRQIEWQERIQEAFRLGGIALGTYAASVWGQVEAAEEAARKERELEQARQDRMTAELTGLDFLKRAAELAGDSMGVLAAEMEMWRIQEMAKLQDLLDEEIISTAEFEEFAAIIDQQVVVALRDAAQAAREQAQAERERIHGMQQSLRLRILEAEGMGAAAQALREQMEVERFLEQGADSATLALLAQAQAAERQAEAARSSSASLDDTTRSMERMSRATAMNAPSAFRLSLREFGASAPGAGVGGGQQVIDQSQHSWDISVVAGDRNAAQIVDEISAEIQDRVRRGESNPLFVRVD